MGAARALKDQGNAHFKKKKHSHAAEDYTAALCVLNKIATVGGDVAAAAAAAGTNEMKRLSRDAHGNLAAAQLQLADWDGALRSASAATSFDKSWHKAHYRRGVALEGQADDARSLSLLPSTSTSTVQAQAQAQKKEREGGGGGGFQGRTELELLQAVNPNARLPPACSIALVACAH